MLLIELEKVDSTNLWVKNNIQSYSTPLCVTATEQTAGRGRYGKQWISPKNENLYLTWAEPKELSLFHYLQASSIALYSYICTYSEQTRLKWPNDIWIDEKKIAGILIEEQSNWAIIGIGLNVNMNEKTLLSFPRPVTSLQQLTSSPFSIKKVQQNVIEKLHDTFVWAKKNPLDCYAMWKSEVSWICGTSLSIQTPTKIIHGTVQEIDTHGNIVLQLADSSITRISNGLIVQE